MLIRAFRLIALAVLGMAAAADATACTCAGLGSPGKNFSASGAVFLGRVIHMEGLRVEEQGGRSVIVEPRIVFEVAKSWKGVQGSRVEIRNRADCGYASFVEGQVFLVYAWGPPLVVTRCNRIKAAVNVTEETAILDLLARGGKEETLMRRLSRDLLDNARPGVRAEAAQLLGQDAPRDIAMAAIPALVRALDDPSLIVRQSVVNTLDRGPWPIHLDDNTRLIARALIKSLSDPEPSIRRDAARALWKFQSIPEAEPALRTALKAEQRRTNPNAEVIAAIASTLATIGSRGSKESRSHEVPRR